MQFAVSERFRQKFSIKEGLLRYLPLLTTCPVHITSFEALAERWDEEGRQERKRFVGILGSKVDPALDAARSMARLALGLGEEKRVR
eukprot:4020330-Pleurochrysis_carterae.AAC.1